MPPIFSSTDQTNASKQSPAMTLRALYHQASTVAEQIKAHAEQAPYPHMRLQLQSMAAEKQKNVAALQETALNSGAGAEEFQPEIQSGRNHWERMLKDLEAQKDLERALLDQAGLLAEQCPELSRLLIQIERSERPHRETLFQLVMRADPQASLT